MKKTEGFTLIELLVVIGIIAILVAFVASNFLGARQRAKDIKKKSELQQMKSALRLYYNDYNIYPGPSSSVDNRLDGCGADTPASGNCADECAGQFAAGGTGCSNVYMKLLPPATDYVWSYQQRNTGDDFCLWTTLENVSDGEIAKSQTRCNAVCGSVAPATDYVVCAD
jgi:prepilin-type N-terminal cleavage/methylation domain-containing protein